MAKDAAWDYECPECGWTTSGWASKKAAEARGAQHQAEHETGEAMPELKDAGV